MALVLTLIIGAKYINFGATVLSNFQCGGVQLIWRAIGQVPTGLAVGAGGDCLSFFLSLSLGYGSKFIEILAQRTVIPKATTNQLYECLIYFYCYLFVHLTFTIFIHLYLYGFYGLIKLFHLCRVDR